jgi:4-hydroxybenzoate polyprenyltransferase
MTGRTKPGAYLLLARVSNLPTIWTNVIAGAALTGAPMTVATLLPVAVGMSCFYTAGMWMNDACDAEADAAARADRPIPSGDVTRREVWTGTAVLTGAGAVAVALARPPLLTWLWVVLLAAAITYYNVRHKRDRFGPLAMGLCRGLVYLVAGAAVAGAAGTAVRTGATVMVLYVLSLTFVGKTLGPRAGQIMPWLIAGISLVDAVVILTMAPEAHLLWVLAAVAGFIATTAGQRVVSGT